jgi:hypothetical protein
VLVGLGPTSGLQQLAGGAVDAAAPRAEQPHVAPLLDGSSDLVARFEHDEGDGALGQVGGGQADPGSEPRSNCRAVP